MLFEEISIIQTIYGLFLFKEASIMHQLYAIFLGTTTTFFLTVRFLLDLVRVFVFSYLQSYLLHKCPFKKNKQLYANGSYYFFKSKLLNLKIGYYLCQSSINFRVICANLLKVEGRH